MNMRTKTIDIAKKSGVSVTTVSRYFNHPELLSQKTIRKIEVAIREMNYSQDPLAKAMVTGNSDLIGVLVPDLMHPFSIEFLSELERYGKTKGLHLLVNTSSNTAAEEKKLMKQMGAYRVRGVILLSHTLADDELSHLGVPVIAVERGGIDVKQINSDYYSNGMLAGQLLLNGGCDIFVSLSCGGNEKAAECKRIFGLEQAVKGYPCEKIVWNMQKDLHMGNVVKRLTEMSIGHKPGVFCANTSIAAIVTEECRKSGLKFPTQLELVGCGKASENSDITSILPDPSLMAQLAIEALNDPLACERVVPVHVVHGTTTSGTEV